MFTYNFEGDYVIVQPYPDGHGPKARELIVTRYLPAANDEEAEQSLMHADLLEGPTLKYFTEVPGTTHPYRLSWRRDIAHSPETICTRVIEPLGRVVGVYQPKM